MDTKEINVTQKMLIEEVQRAAGDVRFDHTRLELSDDSIIDILETIQNNNEALRFLARV